MPKYDYDADVDDIYADELDVADREDRRRASSRKATTGPTRKPLRSPRNEADQAFKCGHCKQFIGAPVSGGRQRNHCPNCLYSKHVDRSHPGDRRSECHSLMAPVALHERRNGELVIIHRCLGCGHEDPNRIAADDNPSLIDRLPRIAEPSETALLEPLVTPV